MATVRMNQLATTVSLAVWMALAGCGLQKALNSATRTSQPTAPILGEPCLVRVQAGKVNMAQGANPFTPVDELTPEAGLHYIAVGFPIGAKQTLAIDDYELLDREDDPQVPFAVGGDGPGAPKFFYDTADFDESVALTKGPRESTGMEGQGSDADPLLVSWETSASVVLLLYEIPADVKSITLRHGSRSFKLEPDAGLINGKPGAGK